MKGASSPMVVLTPRILYVRLKLLQRSGAVQGSWRTAERVMSGFPPRFSIKTPDDLLRGERTDKTVCKKSEIVKIITKHDYSVASFKPDF